MNPCQTFLTPFGVIFANYIGCFIYDGSKWYETNRSDNT